VSIGPVAEFGWPSSDNADIYFNEMQKHRDSLSLSQQPYYICEGCAISLCCKICTGVSFSLSTIESKSFGNIPQYLREILVEWKDQKAM
jgi:hypothetical protein